MFTGETAEKDSGTPSVAGETLVATEDLTKRYTQRVAVEKLTLTLRAGEDSVSSEPTAAGRPQRYGKDDRLLAISSQACPMRGYPESTRPDDGRYAKRATPWNAPSPRRILPSLTLRLREALK
jgi:hypothetical protein